MVSMSSGEASISSKSLSLLSPEVLTTMACGASDAIVCSSLMSEPTLKAGCRKIARDSSKCKDYTSAVCACQSSKWRSQPEVVNPATGQAKRAVQTRQLTCRTDFRCCFIYVTPAAHVFSRKSHTTHLKKAGNLPSFRAQLPLQIPR